MAGPLPARTPSGGSDRISAVAGGSDLVGSTAHGPLFEEPVSDAPMAVESTPSESDDRFFVAPAAVLPLKPRPGARRVEQQVEQQPVRHHRVETIPRGSRLAREAGEAEIVLPDWLGPVSAPAADQAPARARHAG